MTQPSISRTLRQLESELGVELIRRSTVGIELTDAGVEFVEYAREIVDRAAAAQAAMRRRADQQSTKLRVGLLCGTMAAGELATPIFEYFKACRPDVEVELHEIGREDQAKPLRSGEVDVALVRKPLRERDVDVVPVALEPTVVLCSATHELADQDEVGVDEILSFSVCPLFTPDYFRRFWHLDDLRGCSNIDRSSPPARTVFETQLAVSTGRMIAIAASMILRVMPNAMLRTVPLRDGPLATIAVARLQNDSRRVVRDFVEAAVAGAAENINILPGAELPGMAART